MVRILESLTIAGCIFGAVALTVMGFPRFAESSAAYQQYEALTQSENEKLWQAEVTVAEQSGEIVVREQGKGLYHGAEAPVVWENELRFSSKDPARLLQATRTVFSEDGEEVLTSIRRRYDPNTQTLTLVVDSENSDRDPQQRVWKGIDRFATSGSLPFVIQHRLREGARLEEPITVYTSKGRSFHLQPTHEGIESVELPQGTFRCVKVVLRPKQKWLQFILSPILPEIAFWYAEDSLEFVKYEGFEHGLGSPKVVMRRIVKNESQR